ncbi:hypothetical protein TCAL_14678 [Tigriopus californicus]|uniref:Uncharacterized protein n=1 Tax=Tigriopus californicus TaxID=6832 RepID=A0A553NPW9_TIGCA|nr:hypothetical protein TCAL_14678 [Tigriopus californicus]
MPRHPKPAPFTDPQPFVIVFQSCLAKMNNSRQNWFHIVVLGIAFDLMDLTNHGNEEAHFTTQNRPCLFNKERKGTKKDQINLGKREISKSDRALYLQFLTLSMKGIAFSLEPQGLVSQDVLGYSTDLINRDHPPSEILPSCHPNRTLIYRKLNIRQSAFHFVGFRLATAY